MEDKMRSKNKKRQFFFVFFIAFSLIILSVPAFSATLSMGIDNRPYIQLEEGGPWIPVADFITGSAAGMSTDFTSQNSAQRAAYVLEVASEQINQASALGPQQAYDSCLAAMMAAGDARDLANDIAQTSTNSTEVTQANQVVSDVGSTMDNGLLVLEQAEDSGAEPVDPGIILALVDDDSDEDGDDTPADTEPAS
jgi:hypothetical protein